MFEKLEDRKAVVEVLNKILESELAGIVRYTHYSLMIFGHGRIPIVSWMRGEAQAAMTHAQEAGEMITALGERPSLGIGDLLEVPSYDVDAILSESLEHEMAATELYQQLLGLTRDKSVILEEYARRLIAEEESHQAEVRKMMQKPGSGPPNPH